MTENRHPVTESRNRVIVSRDLAVVCHDHVTKGRKIAILGLEGGNLETKSLDHPNGSQDPDLAESRGLVTESLDHATESQDHTAGNQDRVTESQDLAIGSQDHATESQDQEGGSPDPEVLAGSEEGIIDILGLGPDDESQNLVVADLARHQGVVNRVHPHDPNAADLQAILATRI